MTPDRPIASTAARPALPTSLTRTAVPYLAGLLLSIGVIKASGISSTTIAGLVLLVVTQAYYQAARVLEQLDPRYGRLLGAARSAPINAVPAQLRTYIPLIVGFILAHPFAHAMLLDSATLTPIITTAVAGGWYLLGRGLEQISPLFGLMFFGSTDTPSYTPRH